MSPSVEEPRSGDGTSLIERARRVKLLCVDVDGTLTDAGMYYGADGEVMKKFNTRDGMGLARLRQAGVAAAIVSTENTAIIHARAAKLKIDDVLGGSLNKREAIETLRARHGGLDYADIAFVGDDVNDLAAFECVGLACAVADAARSVREAAHYVASRRGGDAAVREVCELIMAARNGVADSDAALVALVR